MLEELGKQEMLEELGKQELLEGVGKQEVLEGVGKQEVLEELVEYLHILYTHSHPLAYPQQSVFSYNVRVEKTKIADILLADDYHVLWMLLYLMVYLRLIGLF